MSNGRLARIASLVFLVLLLDYSVSNGFRALLFLSRGGDLSEIRYAIEESQEDILLLGSSRVKHHLIPAILEDSLELTAYNAGMAGQGIFYHYTLFSAIVERHKPKLVILDITQEDLLAGDRDWNKVPILNPFYGTCNSFDSLLTSDHWSTPVKIQSGLYRFNSTLADILGGLLINYESRSGYRALYGEAKNLGTVNMQDRSHELDSAKLDILHRLFKEASAKGILLITTISPSLYQNANEVNLAPIVERLAGRYNFQLFSFADDTDFVGKHSLFKDNRHLNHQGAVFLSSKLAGKIRNFVSLSSVKSPSSAIADSYNAQ